MQKYFLMVALCFGVVWGALPAQADVNKSTFNLSAKSANVDNMNELVFLKARVAELEGELDVLKKSKTLPKTFGLAYVTEDGKLKCKSEDEGVDWDWNGKTWTRPSVVESLGKVPAYNPNPITNIKYLVPQGQGNCPNGRCPTPR